MSIPHATERSATSIGGAQHLDQLRFEIVPSDYVPLTPEGLLLFCQSKLRSMDEAIGKKMAGQEALVKTQQDVTNIQIAIKEANSGQGFADEKIVINITKMIDEAIGSARARGDDPALIKNLTAVRNKLNAGGDGTVTPDEAKEMGTMLDSTLAACRSGAELSMIDLQSLVARRATALQLVTGMMNSLNEGSKAIAGNIGR